MVSFANTIYELILRQREGEYWDFKEMPHDNNAALLHDILCLANCSHSGDRYLIFGVTDPSSGCEVKGLGPGQKDRKEQSDFIDFLRSKPFAGNQRPEVELRTVTIKSREIDVLVIFDKPYKPFYLTAGYKVQGKEVRANHIYTRTNDSNTPMDSSADLFQIEKMWQQRFGLDLQPGERMRHLLKKPEEWVKDIGNKRHLYHRTFPEYNIELTEPEGFREPFSFFFTNERSFLGTSIFKYHSTILYEKEYMFCDEMRIVLAVPDTAYLRIGEEDQWYYYYCLDNLNGQYLYFLTDGRLMFDSRTDGAPFVIFKNEAEKEEFEGFLLGNQRLIEETEIDFWSEHAVRRIKQAGESFVSDPIFVGKVKRIFERWHLRNIPSLK